MGPERRVRAGHSSIQWFLSGGSWEEGGADRVVMLTLAAQGCLARGKGRRIRKAPRDCQDSRASRSTCGEQANLPQVERQGAEREQGGKESSVSGTVPPGLATSLGLSA